MGGQQAVDEHRRSGFNATFSDIDSDDKIHRMRRLSHQFNVSVNQTPDRILSIDPLHIRLLSRIIMNPDVNMLEHRRQ